MNEKDTITNRLAYGLCEIDFPIEGYCSYAAREFTRPFNILQYCGMVIWFAQGNYLFSIMLLLSTIILTSVMYCVIRHSRSRLKAGTINRSKVIVFRRGNLSEEQEIESRNLVPGDVFAITKGMSVPCDCLLVSGEALMNESSLTGEVVPVG